MFSGLISIMQTGWGGLSAGENGRFVLLNNEDPMVAIFLVVFVLITSAVLGRYFARKWRQPLVLGELIAGILAGTILYQAELQPLAILRHQSEISSILEEADYHHGVWDEVVVEAIENRHLPADEKEKLLEVMLSPRFFQYEMLVNLTIMLSYFGVLMLLFVVGLESSVEDMFRVGATSMAVAVLGVLFPFVLGYYTIHLIDGAMDENIRIFLGATLAATSIGITARVFKDAHVLHLREARIVLGAAVIDDVLGLILLAVVTQVVSSGGFNWADTLLILAKSVAYLAFVYWLGEKVLRKSIRFFYRLGREETPLLYSFALAMILAWLSDVVGLSFIVGAFTAGLILKDELFKFSKRKLQDVISPVEKILAPLFFVMMGLQVDVSSLIKPDIFFIGLVLTLVAIAGKLLSTVALKKKLNKWIVGFGMVPRGEVGLIFASIGKSLGVLSSDLYAVVIMVVVLTTFVAPPALGYFLRKKKKKETPLMFG